MTEVQVIISNNGAGKDTQDSDGMTLLHRIVRDKESDTARAFAPQTPDCSITATSGPALNLNALHYAVEQGSPEMVEVLTCGVSPVCDRDLLLGGLTPLHRAVLLGHDKTVETLAKCQADLNPNDTAGVTPLWRAAARGHSVIVETLMNAPFDGVAFTPTFAAADPDIADGNGFYPLHHAAVIGSIRMVNAILSANANVNIDVKDCRGMRPLALAAANHRTPVVNALANEMIARGGQLADVLADKIGNFHGDMDPEMPCQVLESLMPIEDPAGISKSCSYTRYCTEYWDDRTVQFLLEMKGPLFTQYITQMTR